MSLTPLATESGIEPPDWVRYAETAAAKETEGARAAWAVKAVEAFNAQVPVGTDILIWPGAREGAATNAIVGGPAYLLGNEPMACVARFGGIALAHVVLARPTAYETLAVAGIDPLTTKPCGPGCVFGRATLTGGDDCHCLDDVPARHLVSRAILHERALAREARADAENLRALMIRERLRADALQALLHQVCERLGVSDQAALIAKARETETGR